MISEELNALSELVVQHLQKKAKLFQEIVETTEQFYSEQQQRSEGIDPVAEKEFWESMSKFKKSVEAGLYD